MAAMDLRRTFADNGVTTALIVDDVYDAVAPFTGEDLDAAFRLFEEDEASEEAFASIGGVRPPDVADLERQLTENSTLLDALRSAGQSEDSTVLAKLSRAILNTTALDKEARRKPLDELIKGLEALELKALTVGSEGPGRDAAKFPLIFMDYYLGDENGLPSVARAKGRIMEIVGHYGPAEQPIVVLMSSELQDENQAREFRDEAELLGCQFQFVHKDKFNDSGAEFLPSLADLVQFIKQTRTIGCFVQAWKKALNAASEDFKKNVGRLDLQDYFLIRTKLGTHGAEKFGEHMSGLFDSYLRKLVEDRPELRSATAAVNDIDFEDRPPAPFEPSEIVTRMAFAASFQTPPDPIRSPTRRLNAELGDVYLRALRRDGKEVTEVCAVISQACDLEHGKVATILLIRGLATKRAAAKLKRVLDRPIIRTDLFQHSEGGDQGETVDYIIDWDASDLLAHEVDGFERWAREMNWSKVARLRPVHALALQQKFASHLTRVGMPDTPPPYRYPNVAVEYVSGGRRTSLVPLIGREKRLACVIGEEKPEIVLQPALLSRIGEALTALDSRGVDAAQLEEAKEAFADAAKTKSLRVARLQGGKFSLGAVTIWDKGEPLAPGDNLPKGTFLAIVLVN